jgi:hypothetical protein
MAGKKGFAKINIYQTFIILCVLNLSPHLAENVDIPSQWVLKRIRDRIFVP